MSEKQIAEVSTDFSGLVIAIDGVKYPVLPPEDMTLRESRRMQKTSARIIELYKLIDSDEAPQAVDDEFDALLVSMMDVLLKDVPPAVRGRLKEAQRLQIILAYQQSRSEKKEEARPLANGEPTTDGAPSSRDSSDSTAETVNPGTTVP